VIGHDAAVGAGLTLWGLGLTAALVRYGRRDDVRERTARSRWRFDRRFDRRARRLGEEEWTRRYASSQKALVRWVGIPFAVLWTALAASLLVRGLTG
jgi:hypothetical protein